MAEDDLVAKATERGTEEGRSAASWVFDGNTPEKTYRRMLKGIEDGDPMFLDMLPSSDLSGEWAGSTTPSELGVSADDDAYDEVCRAYEDAFNTAVVDEVERMAREHPGATS